jgi:hypothetical protein
MFPAFVLCATSSSTSAKCRRSRARQDSIGRFAHLPALSAFGYLQFHSAGLSRLATLEPFVTVRISHWGSYFASEHPSGDEYGSGHYAPGMYHLGLVVRTCANLNLNQGMFMEVSHLQQLPSPVTDLRVRRTEVRISRRFFLRSDDAMRQGKAFVHHLGYILTHLLLQRRIHGRSAPHLHFSLHDHDVEFQT